jgi:hypothetical protein
MRSAADGPSAAEHVRADTAEALPAVAAVVLFLLLALRDAGFQPTLWYPVGLALVVLFALVVATGVAVRPPRPTAVAIAALAAFTLWCFASISWSDVRGDALEGSTRTLVYLAAFSLFAVTPLPRGLPVLLVGCYGAGVALVALGTLVRAATDPDPASFFIDGRLAAPAGYQNAAAALFLVAYWAILTLSARRGLQPALRGVLAACATALLGTAVLCQSRGSVIAFGVVCLVQLAVVPRRARSLAALALTGGAVAATLPVLLDVYPALSEASVTGPVRDALLALLAATAGAGLVGWLLARADERVDAPPETSRRLSAIVLAAAALVVVGAGAWAATAAGSPADRLADGWDDFTTLQEPSATGSHLGSGLGSNRYDFWRVALESFAERPLTGVGAENFATDYVRERRGWEEPLHPHSLVVRIVSQTGIVGTVLFALFLAAATVACLRARVARNGRQRRGRRRRRPEAAAVRSAPVRRCRGRGRRGGRARPPVAREQGDPDGRGRVDGRPGRRRGSARARAPAESAHRRRGRRRRDHRGTPGRPRRDARGIRTRGRAQPVELVRAPRARPCLSRGRTAPGGTGARP